MMPAQPTLPAAGQVLVIGNNTVDTVYRVRGALRPDSKCQAESLALYPGGQAANVAHTLGLLDCPVNYVGAFGDDDLSVLATGSLRDAGVGLSGCVAVAGCPTHAATIVVDTLTGSRAIVMYKDDRLRLDPAIITVDLVHSACLVYLDNYEEQASLAAANLAAAGRIPVVADLEYLSEHTLSILSRVDTLIAPKAVLCDLTGEVDPQRLVRAVQLLGPRTVVATAGADGAFGVDAADGLVQVPSRPCRMTDSTGAGDAFHAGYVAGMCRGLDFAARLHLATHVASRKCEVSGPRLTAESVPAIRRRALVGGRQ